MTHKRFKFEINTNQDIDDLKVKIQEKAKLSHLPSYDIDVFKTDNLKAASVIGLAVVSDLEEPLSPSDRIGSHFSEEPPSDLVHVIVRVAKSIFEVFLHHQFIYLQYLEDTLNLNTPHSLLDVTVYHSLSDGKLPVRISNTIRI
jgi:hypothetical protein